MEKEFCTYTQALRLKALGFDEPCLGYYTSPDGLTLEQPAGRNGEFVYFAPLYQQAFRWFREKYKLFSVVNVKYVNGASYFLRIETPPTNGHQYFDEGFKTYEEAELACLDKLLEIVEFKKE